MKKFIYIILICFTLSSCEWLNIEPVDQVSEKNLYSDADGFYNQINGLYKEMATKDMYGREMTWGFLDVMAQYYDVSKTNNHGYKNAATYNYGYERTKSIISPIWCNAFSIISNCNDLISATEKADSMLFLRREMERKMILGEAYAVRAFLHFDMLRLFAPAPVMDDNGKYMPYVKVFPTHLPVKETNTTVLENVIADLETAHALVFKHDSTYAAGIQDVAYRLELQTGRYERYTAHRGYRLNLFAIKAMLARVHHYMGNSKAALYYAEDLIKLHEESEFFQFTKQDMVSSQGNVKLYDDVIFALYNNNLLDYSKEINISSTTNIFLQDYKGIFAEEDLTSTDKIKDYRAKYQYKFDKVIENYSLTKLSEQFADSQCGKFSNRMIPMIRMSEMFYIVAECSYETNKAKAAYMVHMVRAGRGITNFVGADASMSKDEFIDKFILNDLRKEAFGEGQLFYFYKRLNLKAKTKNGLSVTVGKNFVLPLPDAEDIN